MSNIKPEAKIVVLKNENPCREGTERFDRVAAVLKAKRVELALAKGAKLSTIRFCIGAKLVKVAA